MNFLYLLNVVIFSLFGTLLVVETGVAISALLFYKYYRDQIRKYLLPIWEITGTFGVFYLVNFEVTYPTLLSLIGSAYLVPLLVTGIFFLIRSVFLGYSEFVSDLYKESFYIKVYSIAQIAMAFVLVAALGSGVSGLGINVANATIDMLALITSPLSIMVFVAMSFAGIFIAGNMFGISEIGRFKVIYIPIALGLLFFAIYQYMPNAFGALAANVGLAGLLALFAILAIAFQLTKHKYANHIGIVLVFATINIIGSVTYPNVFGKVDITQYIASSAMTLPLVVISLVGGVLVLLALAYFVYISYLKKEEMQY